MKVSSDVMGKKKVYMRTSATFVAPARHIKVAAAAVPSETPDWYQRCTALTLAKSGLSFTIFSASATASLNL